MKDMTTELQKANSLIIASVNKERHMNYRNSAKMTKDIYDYAKTILDNVLGENYTLPIDIKKVAEKLGLVISIEDFSEIEKEHFEDGHDCRPISQLKLRKRFIGTKSDEICGMIYLSNNLSDFSARFAIANQLGHFALRQQKKVGLNLKFEACSGLYPLSNSEEMMADIFALALLLPYHLFQKTRTEYESIRVHWPLDYADWISYIRNKAQIPEYYAVLACQELKKISICLKREMAKNKFFENLEQLGISDSEEQKASLKLYEIVIDNLESRGFSPKQIAQTLFEGSVVYSDEKKENAITETDIVEFVHDYYVTNNVEEELFNNIYPSQLVKDISNRLRKNFVISETEISKIMKIELDNINPKVFTLNKK